mmetsp:Transcript_61075/g.145524  ORF Transcript_61075/g.145524 Transcript_61075/m.145524 type:complete len:233 (-) Transcript_61075:883-1581(-)
MQIGGDALGQPGCAAFAQRSIQPSALLGLAAELSAQQQLQCAGHVPDHNMRPDILQDRRASAGRNRRPSILGGPELELLQRRCHQLPERRSLVPAIPPQHRLILSSAVVRARVQLEVCHSCKLGSALREFHASAATEAEGKALFREFGSSAFEVKHPTLRALVGHGCDGQRQLLRSEARGKGAAAALARASVPGTAWRRGHWQRVLAAKDTAAIPACRCCRAKRALPRWKDP